MDKGYVLRYSGVDKDQRAKEGVGIILNSTLDKQACNWVASNSRIIRIDLTLEGKSL